VRTERRGIGPRNPEEEKLDNTVRRLFAATGRLTRLALATTALATLATGALAEELSGTITVWSWTAPADGLEAAVAGFNKLHPGVTVKVEDVGNPAIWDKITAGMAAGGAGLADVLNIGIDYIGNYIETFPTGLVNLSEVGANDLAAQFPSGMWASGSSADGAVYGIPYEVNTSGFFYRKDLFDQAGVDINSIATWDDLLEAGKKIKEATGAPLISMDKAATVADSAGLWQLLTNLQGSFYFNAAGEITMNGPAGLRSLEWIKKANDAGVVADIPGGWDNFMLQIKGQTNVAVIPAASWAAGVFENEAPDMAGKWGLRLPPSVEPGGLTAAISGGTYLSVAGTSPNKQAAWEFVKYAMGTLEGQQATYEGGGMFPGFKPMLESDGFVKKSAYFDAEVNKFFIDELGQNTPTVNYTTDYARALKAYTDAQTQVLLSGADPKTVLDEAAALVAGQTGRAIAN
jgi:lactose/L-arabinose transport system substrate-binding protein